MIHPKLILTNGRISTLDANNTEVQGLASLGGHIVALGTSAEVENLANETTQIVDLAGRRVVPGIIDSHCHPDSYAARLAGNDIPDTNVDMTIVDGHVMYERPDPTA